MCDATLALAILISCFYCYFFGILTIDTKTLSFTRNAYNTGLSFDLSSLNLMTFSTSYYDDHLCFLGLTSSY
ncbi:hypothetical protein GCM10007906_33630 [Vibrio hyugaensis]|uniref:Uncharacterized protein n=1 Tax=Vibrio hyugaensis TaxID=1534743 RepID=A0ABQ5Y9M7_9VIBR|nr:hypothetical protein GCM10007906_33630 [Vibrio hyugaensis]